MTFHAGKLVTNKHQSTVFIVVSRDKTSEILVKLLTDNGYQVKHFKTAVALQDYLATL